MNAATRTLVNLHLPTLNVRELRSLHLNLEITKSSKCRCAKVNVVNVVDATTGRDGCIDIKVAKATIAMAYCDNAKFARG